MTDIRKHLGSRIRMHRERANLSQETLGAEVGLTKTTLYRLESGVSWPEYENLEAIAKRLGVPLEEFFLEISIIPPVTQTIESLTKIIEDQERRIRELETGQKLDIPEDILQALPKLSEDGLMALRAVIQGDLGSRKVPKTGSKTQSTSK